MANDEQFEAWWDGLTMLDKTTASKGLARAAWSARLPEEHLAVVVEALEVAAYEAQREAKQYRQWSKFPKALASDELADRYAATRRFLKGRDG